MQIADEPVRCSGMCTGIFCNSCIEQVCNKHGGTGTCPSCKKSNTVFSKDLILRNQILKHQVYCPNKGTTSTTTTTTTSKKKRKNCQDDMCQWI